MPKLTDDSSEQVLPEQRTEGNGAERVHLLDLAVVLARHTRLIVRITVGAALLTALIMFILPTLYSAGANILPPQENQFVGGGLLGQLGPLATLVGKDLGMKDPNEVYVAALKTRRLRIAVIDKFKLGERYEKKRLWEVIKKLESRTRISTSSKSGIITVEVDDEDPIFAAQLANGFIRELHRLTRELAVTEAAQRRQFFEDQMREAKERLTEAEIAYRKTQEATGLINPDGQARAIVENMATLRAQIAAREVQLRAMRQFATPENPDYRRTQEELAGLRSQLAQIQSSNRMGEGDLLVPTARIPAAAVESLRRFRDLRYYETILELMARNYELAKLDESKTTSSVQVLDPAIPPERKTRPRRLFWILLATFLSFSFACLLAFGIETVRGFRQDRDSSARLHLLKGFMLSEYRALMRRRDGET